MELTIKQANDCLRLASLLQGQKQALENEKDRIKRDVENSKRWLNKQPEFLKFLQQLQDILHQKNIGAFSQLLSYFVKDVLKKEKDIILELSTYHNLPALKIEASNDGCRENIVEGNGGSIANIVSTGLRLIALSRLSHRKFIILDEPDCWLKKEHVPAFAKIIGEISQKLKIQTIMISHHSWEYFKDHARVIELKTDGKNLYSEIVHDNPVSVDSNHDYIKTIELRNFMSHHNTSYELHPYLTCLIGENDIGKSVIAAGMKAVAYNDSSDSYIKHYQSEAQVLLKLSNNNQIFWQRFRETTQENPQKVKYSLIEQDGSITSEFNSNDTPKFIEKELNIITTEDIDIHIGNQKQPLFLISSDIKSHQRAKILSLGKESLFLQKMMENIKSKTKIHKQTKNEGELKFDKLNKQLLALSSIDENVEKIKSLISHLEALNEEKKKADEAKTLLNEIQDTLQVSSIDICNIPKINIQLKSIDKLKDEFAQYQAVYKLSNINASKTDIKTSVELKPVDELKVFYKRLNVTNQACSIGKVNINISEVDYRDTSDIRKDLGKLNSLIEMSKINKINDNHEFIKIKIKDLELVTHLTNQLKEQEADLADLRVKEDKLKTWDVVIKNEFEEFQKEFGNLCPMCSQPINISHIHKQN